MKITRELLAILSVFSISTLPVFAQQVIYASRFASGLDPRLMIQAPRQDSISISSAGQGSVLKVSINKNDDYSHVANGAPRAELSFVNVCRFSRGKEYLIRWSTLIPDDFEFDAQQPEGIAQIHEGARAGSPPFGLNLNGSRYTVRLEGRAGNNDVADASFDKGKWVQWSLRYIPDDSGSSAVTELYKDGKIVLNGNGTKNAWEGDDAAYFKIGIYKWWWQSRPSNVNVRTMYFGDVTIAER